MAKTNDAMAQQRALRRRRRSRQLLGAVVCLLVVIGAVSVVTTGAGLVAKAFDDTDEKLAYEQRLMTLVGFDPVPFDSLDEANQNTLLSALIWETLANVDKDALEHDDLGAPYLPTLELDKTAASLYGPDYKFTYETFEDRGLTYTYDEERSAFLVPITSAISDYYPQVEKIRREGDTQRVTVGYLSQYNEDGSLILNTSEITPVKYYDYIFTRNDGNYYLSAIVSSEMTASSSAEDADSAASVPNAQDQLMEQLAPETDSQVASDSAAE